MLNIKYRISLISLVVNGLLFAQPAVAGFSTYAKDWPHDAQAVDERIVEYDDPKYVKPTTEVVCVDDTYGTKNFIDEKGRLYFKLGINYLETDVRNLVNNSEGTFAGLNLIKTNAKNNYYSWETGLGTTWKSLRVELEYIHTKETLYNSNPVVVGRSEYIQSTINNTSLLLNFYYDFCNFTYFRPYVGLLWGVAWNKTRTSILGGSVGDNAAQNSSYLSLVAWGLSVGGRIPFYERWHAYVQYKYTDQDRVIWKSRTYDFRMRGRYFVQGFSLGVQYIF